jgi:hypothetical protein
MEQILWGAYSYTRPLPTNSWFSVLLFSVLAHSPPDGWQIVLARGTITSVENVQRVGEVCCVNGG